MNLHGFVLDNSVVMAWCFPDEDNAYADSVLSMLEEGRALVLGIWPLEAANVLLAAERRGRLTPAERFGFVQLLESLPIVVDMKTAARAMHEIMALAHEHGLSSYDAAYLDLAMREGLSLASLDRALRRAAETVGVALT